MKKTKSFREWFKNSLKEPFRIICVSVFLLIAGILYSYGIEIYPGKTGFSLSISDPGLYNVSASINESSRFFIPAPGKMTGEKVIKDLVQQQTVTGVIIDSQTDEPMAGVNIQVKGTTTGTISDSNGKYSILVTDRNATLIFSFIGYVTQEIPLNGRINVDINLQSELKGLDEVVVVGYGTQRKVNITGSVDMVTSDKLESKAVTTVGAALQGVIPNLNIEIRNGKPGTSPSFNIRGYESINGGSPLILVDGVPRDPNHINPDDIDQVSILKDASAAAIYGARGAFGVILIQTKRSQEQDFQINIHSRYTGEIPIWKIDPVEDPYLHMTWANKAALRAGGNLAYEEFRVEQARKYSEDPRPENAWLVHNGILYWCGGGGKNNSFPDMFFRSVVPKQDHSINIQGGTDKAKYYSSIGWIEEPGIFKKEFKGEYYSRLNTDLKVDLKINDWLTLNESISYSRRNQDYPHEYDAGASWTSFTRFGASYYAGGFPSVDLIDEPDYPGRDYSQYEGMLIAENNFIPYQVEGGRNKNLYHDIYLTQGIKLNPLKNFEIRGDFTYNLYFRRNEDVQSHIDKLKGRFDSTIDLMQDEMITGGYSGNTFIINQYFNNNYYVLNAVAEYELDNTGSRHYLKGMVGFNQELTVNRSGRLQAYDMVTPSIRSIRATVGDQYASSAESHLALRGVFYRLNYIFGNRYLFESSGRYDGTSRFPTKDRFGFFPSFSVAWRISEENFMKRFEFLDNLKIRASYGELGNQSIGDYYPYLSTMAMGIATYIMEGERIPYVGAPELVSPTLTWERTRTKNLGVDISLFNQKLSTEFDIYSRSTLDMLMGVTYPVLLGATAPQENAADLETKGWEFKIIHRGHIGGNWDYNIGFNISDWVTEITKYNNPTGSINTHYVGKIMGEIWGYETVGIFQTDEEVANAADQTQLGPNWQPGDIQFADLNDDGKITPGKLTLDDPGDRRIIGNSNARYNYGINLDVDYKKYSLSVFFQGVGKRDWYPATGGLFFPFQTTMIQNYEIEESWTEDNRDAYFPAPTRMNAKNFPSQTRFLQNAAYLRLKNLALRYNFSTAGALGRIGVDNLQVYASGYNLLTFTKMHHSTDPEYIFETVTYPLFRSFTLGAKLSF